MNDYTFTIHDDNSFTGFYRLEEVYKSRAFRLRVQAETQARDWIARQLETPPSVITLDVQNLSIDTDTLFRRLHNG